MSIKTEHLNLGNSRAQRLFEAALKDVIDAFEDVDVGRREGTTASITLKIGLEYNGDTVVVKPTIGPVKLPSRTVKPVVAFLRGDKLLVQNVEQPELPGVTRLDEARARGAVSSDE